MVRVRYAPSPTGHLHIGNARTALFNYLFAKRHNGKFIVRIEDTDTARNIKGGVESQLKYLKWLGIEWDESIDKDGGFGPYSQLERLDIYKKYAEQLVEKGLAYRCYCTSSELEKEREKLQDKGVHNIHYSRKCMKLTKADYKKNGSKEYTIRFKVPKNEEYIFNDVVKGEVKFSSEDIGDWVIMKNNGIPTYNFACVVDDHLMKISHVLRGDDHITNTPKQMMVYKALGFNVPTFGHMTLIVNEDKKKLSKRDESIIQFIEQYADLGYLPDALFNFISLLGWSPAQEQEILSKEELIKAFDEKNLSKSPATFDKDKLTFINNRYIKNLSLPECIELVMPHLVAASIDVSDSNWVEKLVGLFQERMSYGKEIVALYEEFFDESIELDKECKEFLKQDGIKATLEGFKTALNGLESFDAESIKKCIKQLGKDLKVKGKMLFMPCRISTTFMMHGPDLPKAIELLGKDVVTARISKTIKSL